MTRRAGTYVCVDKAKLDAAFEKFKRDGFSAAELMDALMPLDDREECRKCGRLCDPLEGLCSECIHEMQAAADEAAEQKRKQRREDGAA